MIYGRSEMQLLLDQAYDAWLIGERLEDVVDADSALQLAATRLLLWESVDPEN